MIMKLSDIKNGNLSAEWAEKGYELPKFDIEAVKAKTHAEPTWVHFGAGNIFRCRAERRTEQRQVRPRRHRGREL